MTTPDIVLCSDGHYRRVIYGLGPYIADYPEQALLTCVVQGWCPRYVVSAVHPVKLGPDVLSVRCTAPFNDLDSGCGRRSHELTRTLLDAFDLKTLWEDYGVIGDIVVRSHSMFALCSSSLPLHGSRSPSDSLVPTSMS